MRSLLTTATLVIDMQVDFFSNPRLAGNRSRLVGNLNALVSGARRVGSPIIWVRQVFAHDLSDAPLDVRRRSERLLIEGSAGAALLPELDVRASDLSVTKKRHSAFFKTELDGFLAQIGCKTLIVAGVNSHECVRATVVDAYQRDYDVWIASDCLDSHDEQHHWITFRYMRGRLATAMSNAQIDAQFRSSSTVRARTDSVDSGTLPY